MGLVPDLQVAEVLHPRASSARALGVRVTGVIGFVAPAGRAAGPRRRAPGAASVQVTRLAASAYTLSSIHEQAQETPYANASRYRSPGNILGSRCSIPFQVSTRR